MITNRAVQPKYITTRVIYLILVLLPALPEQAISSLDVYNTLNRPRVGLVLSGGGALGFAHIGVLQVLEELHVPVDCIVGTSMGALVAGSYAAGVSPDRMQSVITATDINALFDDDPARKEIAQTIKNNDYLPLFDFTLGYRDGIKLPSGASAGYKFELFLNELIGPGTSVSDQDFDQLPVPYRAIATDLETGEMKVFSSGELTKVMRASMSLPSILAPTEIDDRTYIDGGLVRNLPIDVGRELCGDVLIAVNLGTTLKTGDRVRNSLEVALQSIVILTNQNVQRSLQELKPDDVLIVPDLEGFASSSFASQREIIERGIVAARASEKQLLKLALTPEEYRSWKAKRKIKIPQALKITRITTEVTGSVAEKAVLRDVATHAGEDFDVEKLDNEITGIFGRGDFSYVGYSIVPDENNATVIIKADSKPWGPGYLKFGLGAATDFTSPTQLNLAVSYRQTWINSLGAEWRTDAQIGYDSFLRTEFIQPLQLRDGVFLDPYILARRNFIQLYNDDIRLGDYKIERYQAGLDVGITNNLGEIRVGGFANSVSSKPGLGAINPLFTETSATQTGFIIKGIIDQLDSYVFPTAGLFAIADIRSINHNDETTSEEFTRAQLELRGAWSFQNNTVAGKLEWGDELSGIDDLPIFEVFKLGGPNRLSGLYLDQLTGTRYQLATLNFYHRYANLLPQIGRGVYVGVSLESGRINDPLMQDPWDRVYAGSVYWGADTKLGATYIGYGRSSLDQSSFYLIIGPRF